MRVTLVSTHRADRGHYAPLRALLESDARFSLVEVQPDVAVVLGDRCEMLLQAVTWVERRVPLVHIHGGEHTYGSLDERYRYAITALADWHCVATENAKLEVERYLITGEWGAGPRRGFTDTYRKTANCVVVTGAPGLDGIRRRKPTHTSHPFVIALLNPVINASTTRQEAAAMQTALAGQLWNILWLEPNGDRFSNLIWEGAQLTHERFRDLLADANVIVGNSSAGIIEAPSFGTWSVNIGERQAGRERAPSVIDVIADPQLIREAIGSAIERGRAPTFNPYNRDGRASERVRDVLLGIGERETLAEHVGGPIDDVSPLGGIRPPAYFEAS